jgi:diguanylate cyclase (GGDEF)-like protein/PAS domain S-box-containing protein
MSPGPTSTVENVPSITRDGLFIFLTVFVAGSLSGLFAHAAGGIYPIWWPNGVLLAALLLSEKQRWPLLLLSGGFAMLLSHAPLSPWQPQGISLTLSCLAEVWVAATIIRWWAEEPFFLTSITQTVRFVIIAVLFAPLISGIFTLALMPANPGNMGQIFLHWYLADALGIATATPVIMAAFRGFIPRAWNPARTMESTGLIILLIVGGSITLFQPEMALLTLLFPLIIVIVVRMGWITGALGVLILSVLASAFTVFGRGPFHALYATPNGEKIIGMQLFVAALTVSAAIVASVHEERRRMLELAREKERSIRILTESSPDVMLLNDLSGRILYATSAVKRMLGYQPGEIYRKSFQFDLLHTDEIPAYRDSMDAVRRRNETRTLIYRVSRKDGTWMWAEGCISLYREQSSNYPIGYVNVLRDITHRKAAEDRLQTAYNELEILAAIDSLTGVANRRHFDAVLDAEWKRAERNGTTLSMLLIDVDFFKNFNDIYGHIAGDECLRDIASIASQCIRRYTDVVSRFGGEEFAVILPETDEAGGAALAERIRASVQAYAVQHAGNVHGLVTISIGCAAMIPARGKTSLDLIECADKALYRAKSIGRNAVVRASMME